MKCGEQQDAGEGVCCEVGGRACERRGVMVELLCGGDKLRWRLVLGFSVCDER